MKARIVRIFFIMLVAFSVSGCSYVLTRMGPMLYRLEDGEKSVGEFAKYRISGSIQSNVIFLEKVPLCPVIAEKVRIAQKQRRGRVFSAVEMVFFGLGLYDALKSEAVVENSKEIMPLGEYATGEFVACGEKQPAASELLIISDKQQTFETQARTDTVGSLDLKAVIGAPDHVMHLSVRLASAPGDALAVIYRPER